jgi:hypothetical protein
LKIEDTEAVNGVKKRKGKAFFSLIHEDDNVPSESKNVKKQKSNLELMEELNTLIGTENMEMISAFAELQGVDSVMPMLKDASEMVKIV